MILRHLSRLLKSVMQGPAIIHLLLLFFFVHAQYLKVPQNTDVVEGDTINMECQVDPKMVNDDTKFIWIIKENPVSTDNFSFGTRYKIEMNKAQGIYNLKIMNANYSLDDGIARCFLSNIHSQDSEAKITVLIPPGKPNINVAPQRIIEEGEKLSLNCSSVGGNPAPNITWYRNDIQLNSVYEAGGNIHLPSTAMLNLNPVRKEDNQAVFTCKVSSRALMGSTLTESSQALNVRYYPRVSIVPYSTLQLEQGSMATVTCKVDSNPGVSSVQWRRNGILLPYTSLNLPFASVNKSDGGNYTCTADNGLNGSHSGSVSIEVLYGPEVIVSFSKIIVNESGSIDVKCMASANPSATAVQWTKIGESFLSRGENLHLNQIKRYDAGIFTCTAENQLKATGSSMAVIRKGSANMTVTVQYPSGKAIITPSSPKALLGQPFSLQCSSSEPGVPLPLYRWIRFDGKQISSTPEGVLNFSEIMWADNGQYQCQAVNILGKGDPATIMLEVNEPASFVTLLPESIVFKEHDKDKQISCITRGKPPPYISWFKDGLEISQGNHMYSFRFSSQTVDTYATQVESMLEFKGPDRGLFSTISRDDVGNFTCQISNLFVNHLSSSVFVYVQYAPLAKSTRNLTAADLSDTASLDCNIEANPRPQIAWGRNGQQIMNNTNNYVIREYNGQTDSIRSVLSVKDVRTQDMGDYVCFAANILGNTTFVINLRQKSVPEVPKGLREVNSTHNSVFLTWDPGFDGGDPQWFFIEILNDTATPKKIDVSPENTTFFEIRNLEAAKEYTVQLCAQNRKGRSSGCAETKIYTKEPPFIPEDIPRPNNIEYNKENRMVIFEILKGRRFNIAYNKLCAVVTLTYKQEGTNEEHTYTGNCDSFQMQYNQPNKYTVSINDFDVRATITKIRVMLCYQTNEFNINNCGPSDDFFLENPKSVKSAELPLEILIPIVVVGGIVLLAIIIILAVVFYRRKKKPIASNSSKKEYELETSHSRPRAITAPFYPDGISNHALDNHIDLDDSLIGGIYSTNSSGLPPPYTSVPDSYLNTAFVSSMELCFFDGGLYPDSESSRKRNKSDSLDNSPDLWVKNNGHIPLDQPWDSEVSLRNGYPNHTNYNDYDEDIMNRQNRSNLVLVNGYQYATINKPKRRNKVLADSPYIEVSGLPDPYELDEEKSPTSNISFDDSIESGYSTPNSKAGRRVIREIIV